MKKIFALLVLTLAIFATGCGDDSGDKTFKVMLSSNVVSLDISQIRDTSSFELVGDCIDGLMQQDEKGNPIPAIAESYDVSSDGKTYTFRLRDAKWANGDPVTANDFVFAWRRQCKEAGEYAYMLGSTVACIKNADEIMKNNADPTTLGVSAPDEKTFVVELTNPVAFFPSLMSFPIFFPINEKFYNSVAEGQYGTSPETFLSNGAFVLTEYMPGAASISLKKNDQYWDAENVTLPEFQYQVVSSSDNALVAFKNKTLDIVTITGNQVESVNSDENLAKDLKILPTAFFDYLSFNQDPKNADKGALANVNLRLAISKSIDRESIATNYLMNGAKETYTAMPIDFAPDEKTGESFTADQKEFLPYIGFNPQEAKEYLAKAKQELGRENFTFTLIHSNDAGNSIVKLVQVLKAQIEETLPGVKINLQPMPKAEYLAKITSNDYDLAVANWTPDYDDPMTFLNLWTTENCAAAEHWSNPEYDLLIKECTTGSLSSDYEARRMAMHEAEEILLKNAVIAPMFTDASAVLTSPDVSGVEYHTVGINRVFKHVKVNR